MLQQLVKGLQDQDILDRAAEPIQGPARRAFRATSGSGRALKNFLSGTWIGHPLHPILKDLPIGGWTMAALFDALSMERASDVCVGTGLAGALASAVTGLADWSDTYGRARRIGVLHAAVNASSTALYTASFVARKTGHRATGIRLAYAGYGVMLFGAYLGGHLVFAEQIGVNHAAQSTLLTDFVAVLPESELLQDQPRRVRYKGLSVVLVRQGTNIYALYERCSHMGGPLAKGTLEGGSIRCPWHGSRFALEDGRVVEGPATSAQPCFETRVMNGGIEIRSREPEAP